MLFPSQVWVKWTGPIWFKLRIHNSSKTAWNKARFFGYIVHVWCWLWIGNKQAKTDEMCIRLVIYSLASPISPAQNVHHYEDIFKGIFLKGNLCIWIQMSSKFVPRGSVNNEVSLVLVIVWHLLADKPFPEPIMRIIIEAIWYYCTTVG